MLVRVPDTVRRPPQDAEFVHALLGWFERRDWGGAARFLGIDELGREVLSCVGGHAARAPAQAAWPPKGTGASVMPADP
jgi:hypothetical protein